MNTKLTLANHYVSIKLQLKTVHVKYAPTGFDIKLKNCCFDFALFSVLKPTTVL